MFAGPGKKPLPPKLGWGRRPYFELVGAEHRAVREAVGVSEDGLWDLTRKQEREQQPGRGSRFSGPAM